MFGCPQPGIEKFVWPVFVISGHGVDEPLSAMPGQSRMSADILIKKLDPLVTDGLGGVLLFGVPDRSSKDAQGSGAFHPEEVIPRTVTALKRAFPELIVFTDVCLCAYTDHGHCGLLAADGQVDNDATLALLQKTAVTHAHAGADVVAPSAMMDGQVQAVRAALDAAGRQQTLLMSYSTKFASCFYDPFREAEQSAPSHGDRHGYQASYHDLRSALRESLLDEAEGADILMVKPALFYLDIIQRLRQKTDLPLAAYNVSGEYAMLIAAAERGSGDLGRMVRESITAIQRAGADMIISYWANQYREIIG